MRAFFAFFLYEKKLIAYVAVRLRPSIFSFLWHGGLLILFFHWRNSFFPENRAYFFFSCSMVEMFVSSLFLFLPFKNSDCKNSCFFNFSKHDEVFILKRSFLPPLREVKLQKFSGGFSVASESNKEIPGKHPIQKSKKE